MNRPVQFWIRPSSVVLFARLTARPIVWTLWVALGFMVSLSTGCVGNKAEAGGPPAPMPPPPLVVVAPALVKTVPVYGEYVGQTDAKETVNIQARVSGFLEKVYFTEGSRVEKDQVLFQIEQGQYKAAVDSARAKLAQDQATLLKNQKDVARLQPLVEQQAAPQQDLDQSVAAQSVAEAAIQADRAAIEQAELNLGYTIIRSPITGIIGKLQVNVGNLVGQGQTTTLATASSYDPIYLYFGVPEAAYLESARKHPHVEKRLTDSEQLELILADNSLFPHHGRINFRDRAIDSTTGTLRIRGEFPNPEGLLKPGQFTRVRIATEERPNAILIPQRAVMEALNAKGVLVIGDDNKVSLKTIITDGTYQDYFIVRSGLQGGERVIVEGLQKVRPGMVVKPTDESAGGGE